MPHIYKRNKKWFVVEESYTDLKNGLGIYNSIHAESRNLRTAFKLWKLKCLLRAEVLDNPSDESTNDSETT